MGPFSLFRADGRQWQKPRRHVTPAEALYMIVAQMRRWRLNALARPAIVAIGLVAALSLTRTGPAAAVTFDCSGTGSPQGPYSFETWEAGDYKSRYGDAMGLASVNQLFPENSSFALPALETGDRSAGSGATLPPYIPPVLLKAISYIESGWAQASYDPLVQYGETGPTLVSADCGYGLMQVTSGMQNVSGAPSLDQAMIGGHYAYNIARGAQILAGKWNAAPEYRPIMGNRDPHVIENWYFALWAYNGFAYRNHPLNPGYNTNRPPYDCQGDTPRDYPYQELIFGCVANPPLRDGVPLWDAQPISLPNLSDPAYSGPLDINNWNACSFELQCAALDIPTPADAHTVTTLPSVDRATLLGAPALAPDPASIALSTETGIAQASLAVPNAGTGLGVWRVRPGQTWLKVSRVEGISQGADVGGYSTQLILDIDLSTAPGGDHFASVLVDSAQGAGSLITVPVSVRLQRVGCDNLLTVVDVLAILNNASGIGGCVSDVHDTNCDGKIDGADIVAIMRFLIGLPPTQFCE